MVKERLRTFLQSSTAEVMVLTGGWGVGKSYLWNALVKEAADARIDYERNRGVVKNPGLGMNNYSYVSAFGAASVEALQMKMVFNSVSASQAGCKPTLGNVKENGKIILNAISEGIEKKWPFLAGLSGLVKSFNPSLLPLLDATLICLDDIERCGRKLEIVEILGLATELKERHGCKVLLILNHEQLNEQKESFGRTKERVVDCVLELAPTAAEAAALAMPSESLSDRTVRAYCERLGILNLRTLFRIKELSEWLVAELKGYDDQVIVRAMLTATLSVWCSSESPGCPNTEYLKTGYMLDLTALISKSELSADRRRWYDLLQSIGFSELASIDQPILQSVEKGYRDSVALRKGAEELQAAIKAGDALRRATGLFSLLHDSIANNNNQEKFRAEASFLLENCPQMLSINYVDVIASLFNRLGEESWVSDFIDKYVETVSADYRYFDISTMSYDINNKLLKEKVSRRFQQLLPIDVPEDLLAELSRGWSSRTITQAAKLSVNEMEQHFRNLDGPNLKAAIEGTLRLGSGAGDNDVDAELRRNITSNAKAALARIASESTWQAIALERYGITPETKE